MTTPQHVIFGTGAIGLATFEGLRRRGETVRLVNRSGQARVPDDTDVIGGDARDPTFTADVAKGARVVYQTLNPPYPKWVELFPALQASVLAAVQATGARLVSMENVYMYGPPNGQPLTETRPLCRRHQERHAARPHGPRAPGGACGRQCPGGYRPGLGLLRAPRRRPVDVGRPGHASRAGR